MSDKKISQLSVSSTLDPTAIIPVTQTDTMTGLLTTFGVTASTLWAGAGGTGVGTFYSFPNNTTSTPVTSADIGLLAMNDGTGTAKVYATSPAVPAVEGQWTIVLNTSLQALLNTNSQINFTTSGGNGSSIDRASWFSGTPTPYQELLQIKAAIGGLGFGTNLSVTDNGLDTVYITENGYQGYSVTENNMPTGSFNVVQLSLPAQPVSPTAFPLGKIIGVQGTGVNSTVQISANLVETYTLSSSTTLDELVFNSANYSAFDFGNATVRENIAAVLAVPGANGTVAPFDLSRYTVDNTFPYAFRDQLLGLIISVNGSSVTVLHLNGLGPILNVALKGVWYGNNH